MKNFIRGALALLILTLALPSQAAIRVLATTADWGALATELGGERVDVYVATTRDAGRASRRRETEPGRARAHGGPRRRERRRARGRLAAGAAAGSPAMRASSAARRATSRRPSAVKLLEVPSKLDRAHGRHPSARQSAHPARSAQHRRRREGAHARSSRRVDPAGADYYAARGADFAKRWDEAIGRWESEARRRSRACRS